MSYECECGRQTPSGTACDHGLAAAQKRIAELEAQVAQHPEQLRRVAETLRDLTRVANRVVLTVPASNNPHAAELARAVGASLAIIAEATKPKPSAPTDGGSAP